MLPQGQTYEEVRERLQARVEDLQRQQAVDAALAEQPTSQRRPISIRFSHLVITISFVADTEETYEPC